MNLLIQTPEITEARKPIEKVLDMYLRGVITKMELVHRLTEYALSFKEKSDNMESEDVKLPPDFPMSESSYRIHQAAERLKTMPLSQKIDIMVSAKLITPEEAETAKERERIQ